jgi:teichuronic acid biosynthesis glycosyltransferase TuaG
MTDFVSVIMPVYNAQDFVADAIKSVQRQTHQDWELLVIDDCSSDETIRIVRSVANADWRIRVLQQEGNGGAASARNRGLAEVRGAYIAFLDSDDRWAPEKLAKQIGFMKSNGVSFSFTAMFRDRSAVGRRSYVAAAPQRVSYHDLLKSNSITCSSVILDSRLLGPARMPLIPKNEDFCLWLQLLKKTEYAYGLSETCGVYTVRRQSVSSSKFAAARELWRIYRRIEELGFLTALYYLLRFVFHWSTTRTVFTAL